MLSTQAMYILEKCDVLEKVMQFSAAVVKLK